MRINSTAWARHVMCESALRSSSSGPPAITIKLNTTAHFNIANMLFHTPLTYYLNKVAHSCKTSYYISYKKPKVNGTSGISASHAPISMLLLLPTAGNYKVQHRVTNGTIFIQSFVQIIKSSSENLNRHTCTHIAMW